MIDQQDDTTHDFYLTNENENGEEVFDEAFERCYDIDQLEDDLANSDVLISHVVYPEILTDWKFGM